MASKIVGILIGAALIAALAYLASPKDKDSGCTGNCSSCSGCSLSKQEKDEIKVRVKEKTSEH